MKKKRLSTAATINDVAERAGLSIKTVSRVLNDESPMREETKARVLEAIRELAYRPNFSARNLAGGKPYLIALLYDNPSPSYLADLQRGALQACEEHGFSLILHPCDYKSPALTERVAALIRERRSPGIVLSPPVSDVAALMHELDRQGASYVRIAPINRSDSSPYVAIDDLQGACDITEYLLKLGHRRIAFIKGHPDHGASAHRLQGYQKALKQAGIEVDPSFTPQGYFSFDSGIECAERLLKLPVRPTAIFASNDDMAAGVLHVLHEAGISVPGEISVAGYDDSHISRYVWPSLTTVRQPVSEMAKLAVLKLIATIRNQEGVTIEDERDMLKYQLVARNSTGPAPSA